MRWVEVLKADSPIFFEFVQGQAICFGLPQPPTQMLHPNDVQQWEEDELKRYIEFMNDKDEVERWTWALNDDGDFGLWVVEEDE